MCVLQKYCWSFTPRSLILDTHTSANTCCNVHQVSYNDLGLKTLLQSWVTMNACVYVQLVIVESLSPDKSAQQHEYCSMAFVVIEEE